MVDKNLYYLPSHHEIINKVTRTNGTLHNGHCTVGHFSFQIFDNNGEERDEEILMKIDSSFLLHNGQFYL